MSRDSEPDLMTPLGDAELDALEDVLVDNETSIPWVEGLFAAVHTGPDLVTPATWLPLCFGEDAFDTGEDARRVLDLVTRLYNEVGATLRHDPRMLSPEADAVDELEAFCDGYLAGAQLHAKWSDDPSALSALDGFRAVVGEVPADEETFRAHQRNVPNVIALLWTHWEKAREEAVPPSVPVRSTKVGRNDVCPCGSGKKYKKCCAN